MFGFRSIGGRYESALTNHHMTSVISVQRQSESRGQDSPPFTRIKIANNDLQCFMKSDDQAQHVRNHRLRSQFSALQGYVFDHLNIPGHYSVKFSPNFDITIDGHTFTLAKGNIADYSRNNFLWYYPVSLGNAVYDRVGIECMHASDDLEILSLPACAVGDIVPADPTRVISKIFPHSGNVEIMSTTAPKSEKPVLLPAESVGCTATANMKHWIRLVETQREKKSLHIRLSSPVCESPPTPSKFLTSLYGTCFTANLIGRQFEYCHGDENPRIRILQPRPRVHAKWPLAISAIATSEIGEWTIRNGRLYSPTAVTNTNCAINQPGFGDGYLITVPGIRSLSITGIGGSFNPMTIPYKSGTILGIAVYDPNSRYGCEESGFPHSILPPSGTSWIAIVDRGECMFQDKGLVLQSRGAVAVIVVNGAKSGMIGALAGIPGKPILDIPVVLVDGDGAVLKSSYIGNQIAIRPKEFPHVLDEKISFKTEWFCDPGWDSVTTMSARDSSSPDFGLPCQSGDSVMLHREGEAVEIPAKIIEEFGGGFFSVESSGEIQTVPGWQIFRDSTSPCTAQFGTYIDDVVRSDTCQITLRLHSSVLCADKRFRRPKQIANDIVCEYEPHVE